MRALQLDAVEPAADAPVGHGAVAVDDGGDLVALHRLRHLSEQGIGNRARGPHRQAGVEAGGLAAVVIDLGEHGHAMGVDGVGDPPVALRHRRVEAMDELLVGPVGRVRGVLLGDDEPCTSGRPGPVVGGVLLGGEPVGCVVGEMGGEDDAVGHHNRPEAQRGEEMAVPSGAGHVPTGFPPLTGPTGRRRRPGCGR